MKRLTSERRAAPGPDTTRAFAARGRRATGDKNRPHVVGPASMAQRLKVRDQACVVCQQTPTDPAHLMDHDRSAGADDALAVLALCRGCHDRYAAHELDLLPHLERRHREELCFAVQHFGLVSTYRRVTGGRRIEDER